jgi:ribosomal protein S18 acetylase RimI-like enzyme
MKIRPAAATDLPAISAIQAASREAAQWNCADYLQHSCLVADMGGVVAGFFVGRPTAPGEHEILNLAVDPGHRRKGIARALLQAAMGAHQTWFLEVRESNQAAIAFYTSAGFGASGRREKYYRDPLDAGIVMRRIS